MDIPNGTQNVILYCICRRTNNVAVGPTTWFITDTAVARTKADGSGNPYYRDNVPSPLIIPAFTATRAGIYGCGGGVNVNTPSVTIDLAILGMCNWGEPEQAPHKCSIYDRICKKGSYTYVQL